MSQYQERSQLLQKKLRNDQAFLLSVPADIHYFSGLQFLVPEEREAFFLVTPANFYLIYSSFTPLPAEVFFQLLDRCSPANLAKHLLEVVSSEQLREILVDKSNLHVDEFEEIQQALSGKNCALTGLDREIIWAQRMQKDAGEIVALREAGRIVARVMSEVEAQLRPGLTERQLLSFIEDRLRALGSEKPAFPLIVAFGAHAAATHHQPDDTVLTENTCVLVDIGATSHGYRSDMTRTFWFGSEEPTAFQRAKRAVREAYDLAIRAFSKSRSLTAKDIDLAARDYLIRRGLGDEFIHTTGHGVGIDIHEPPSLNWRNEQRVAPSMVVTIEPGVYFEGKFGYRYENTVLVTERGAEELTKD